MKKKLVLHKLILITLSLLMFEIATGEPECKHPKNIVLYGSTSLHPEKASNVYRVFIDRLGFFYPDVPINDADLLRNCGSIKELLLSDTSLLHQLVYRYRIPVIADNNKQIDLLRMAIAAAIADSINAAAEHYKRTDILIHGFRKTFYGISDGTTSVQDNVTLENSLSASTSDNSIQYIEIYWDGKYRSRHIRDGGIKKGLRLFEEEAIPSAYNAGLALRYIVSRINRQHLNIITHSLGAMVASELLFNTATLPDEPNVACPTQYDIRWCMIAPAISADLFKKFYSRGNLAQQEPDRYKIFIAYNRYDFVLMKTFKWHGIGKSYTPIKYGNTSLGCDYNSDISKFQKNISMLPKPICVDFSEETGAAHHINQYLANPAFKEALIFLK